MEAHYYILLAVLLGAMGAMVPVYMALFFTGVVGIAYFSGAPLLIQAQAMFKAMDNFALVVVLFFILCGNVMVTGSIVQRLIAVANATVGWLPGGLAMAGVVACALFGAISGSTVATVVAIGGFMIPALLENKYPLKFTVGIMTSSPILGIIIPPSISMILYATVTNASVEMLFLSGYLPGLLIVAVFSLYSFFVFRNRTDYVRTPPPTWATMKRAYREGFWSMMLPVIIFVGIYSGAFTANEAAVVASVYAFVVELFIHKTMRFQQVFKVTVSSAVTSATLLMIVAGATVFGKYLTIENIPAKIADAVTANITSPWVFMAVINVFFLVVGMFMDIISATLIITPIILPLLFQFNIDLVHFGLLMTVNLGIGYITPPVGVSLYITGAMVNRDVIYVIRAILPFLAVQILVLALLVYWPDFVLVLPRFFGYTGG
jgi:C4-dicarboxylate transporter DctM subunit